DSAGAGLKKLSAVATQQALIVVLAGVVTAVLLHFLVAIPATESAYDRAITVEADSAQQRLNHYLSAMQDQVQAVAGQPFVADTIASQSDLRVLSQQLLQAVSGASAVFVFPHREIPRTGNGDTLLWFAGLELARRAENGPPLLPDGITRVKQWYLQLAAAARSPSSAAVISSALVVFVAYQVTTVLGVGDRKMGGRLSLVQTVAGSARTVISAGSGS